MHLEHPGLHLCHISVSSAINALVIPEAVIFDCLNTTEPKEKPRIISVNFIFPKRVRASNTVERNRIMLKAGECVTRVLKGGKKSVSLDTCGYQSLNQLLGTPFHSNQTPTQST
jgi:hypothetical protein